MSTKHEIDDSLSALMDGELSDRDAQLAIRELVNDPARRARFAEYSAIGDLMRGHRDDFPDLTDKVMAALDAEPTLLAPTRKPRETARPLLWLAAAACAAITWGLWTASPRQESVTPLASAQMPERAPNDVGPYLAAHQDYAQAVLTVPEMRFTRVSLSGEQR
jgi:sigma-E factor negative regulatory protein RseA